MFIQQLGVKKLSGQGFWNTKGYDVSTTKRTGITGWGTAETQSTTYYRMLSGTGKHTTYYNRYLDCNWKSYADGVGIEKYTISSTENGCSPYRYYSTTQHAYDWYSPGYTSCYSSDGRYLGTDVSSSTIDHYNRNCGKSEGLITY